MLIFMTLLLLMHLSLLFHSRNQPCTPARVFELTWTLFVCIKVDYPEVRDDLVNSYHMLLACCDLIFANALLSDRRDLLNPVFPGKFRHSILFS